MSKTQTQRPPVEVFVTHPISPQAIALIEPAARIRIHDSIDPLSREEMLREVRTATGLVTFLIDPIDREVIDAAPGLRVIANVAVGFNNIDIEYAAQRGIWVTNTPGVLTDATADATLALLLAVARRIVPADRFVRNGSFKRWEFDLFLGHDLCDRKIGIIGMGAIGQAVARRTQGFGMKVLYHDPNRLSPKIEKVLGARYVPLHRLLRESDFVSLHVPLNPATRHLLGREEFRLMKKEAILVNTSRGPVVDEKALVQALREGRLAGAGLDVFENEPQVENELLGMEQVVLLPHIASATAPTRLKMTLMAARNAVAVLRHRRPANPVLVPARRIP